MNEEGKTEEGATDEFERRRQRASAREQNTSALSCGQTGVENLLESSAVATFVLNPRHEVVLWNRACEELTGIPASDIIGTGNHWKPFYEHKRPTLADIVIDGAFESIPSLYEKHSGSTLISSGLQAEGWYERLNNRSRYILFDAAPVFNGMGELSFVIETLQDITGRKEAEDELRKYRSRLEDLVLERTSELGTANEQLRQEIIKRKKMEENLLKTEKLESLGILAGGIAHDFNNLLSSILGNISLAKLHAQGVKRAVDLLMEAEKALYRARDLTRQLLTFSKGGEPIKKIISLPGLIRDSADFALRGSSVVCRFEIPDDLWPVEVDPGQISQVIHNLIINADQSMPGGGTIHIQCENVAVSASGPPLKEGKYIKIMIKDQGVGIPKEHLQKIFDPYFTTKQKGSGLGLATSYSIISKHEGHLSVDSTPEIGTSFHIYIRASDKEVPADTEKSKHLYRGKGKVLVMDDEEIIRLIAAGMLREMGYTYELAETGEEAIRLYEKAMGSGVPFDIVILDLTIRGGMGGLDCMEHLLKINPAVKAIVSSGYSDDPSMSNYRELGFRGIITKPYQVEDLSEILHKVRYGIGG